MQSDLFNMEGRKDKRKQKRCWSLSTGRAWLEVSLQQAHWLRKQPITRAAREGKAALPVANRLSVCHFSQKRNVSGINCILNYNMNLLHVIHIICNITVFQHFRSHSLGACIINGFNGSLVFLVICMLMNINKANTHVGEFTSLNYVKESMTQGCLFITQFLQAL